MHFDEIKQLFPSAYIQEKPSKQYFSLPLQKRWLIIPDITKREQTLLTKLMQPTRTLSKNPWVQYLQANGAKPKFTGQIRFLFFKHAQTTFPTQKIWLTAIKNMFISPILASFSLPNSEYCFIEKLTLASYNLQDFIGVLQTVTADSGLPTKLYLGHPWNNSGNLEQYFAEELQIFEQEQEQSRASVFSFANVALPYFTKKALHKSNIINYYQNIIKKDAQLINIIGKLYQNQGNISKTAKQLYLHRNTLLYHIEKVNQEIGLDLKQMDDLLLAYLAIL